MSAVSVGFADFDGDGDLDAFSARPNEVLINQGGDQGGIAGDFDLGIAAEGGAGAGGVRDLRIKGVDGTPATSTTGVFVDLESEGFRFTLIPEADLNDTLSYVTAGGGGADTLGFVPTGEDFLATTGGLRIELIAGGTFDFGGFELLGHARTATMHVASYDEFDAQIGTTFDFDTSSETSGGGGAPFTGAFHTFDTQVANTDVAYVEITFDNVGLSTHNTYLDDFLL